MAVSVEYQAWDSVSYNWLDNATSTAAPQQINDKLAAWVTAVNANASNTNKQITIHKGPADSTSANYIGWVLELASSSSGSGFYTRFYSSTTTNTVVSFSSGWTNDSSNGGYGAASGASTTDGSVTWFSSGVLAEFSIATETTDGEEFFCLGWRLNNANSSSDVLLIFKDSNGEWASYFSDGGTDIGSFYMPTHTTPQRNYTIDVPLLALGTSPGYLYQFVLTNSASTYVPAVTNEYTGTITAASPALYATYTTSEYGYGRWASVSGSRTAVCMSYGQIYVVF